MDSRWNELNDIKKNRSLISFFIVLLLFSISVFILILIWVFDGFKWKNTFICPSKYGPQLYGLIPRNEWTIQSIQTPFQMDRFKEIMKRLNARLATFEEITSAMNQGANIPIMGIYQKEKKDGQEIEIGYAMMENQQLKQIENPMEYFRKQPFMGLFVIGEKPSPVKSPRNAITVMPFNSMQWNAE